jgi:Uma2 family endonuclease
MGTTTSLLTFEEFERLPDEPGKLELLDGELFHVPPVKLTHMQIAERLFLILKQTTLAADVHIEMGYKIGRSAWLQPDVSIARPNQASGEYLEGAPLLAIEVISDSNPAQFMDRKVKKYLSNGGVEVWLVYPRTRCVWIFRGSHAQEFRGVLKTEILPAIEIDLDRELFA